MPRNILVAVAWPYVNGEPHLGHIAGMNVPADIFARFHRMIGNNVAMVSGSDMHGTPTALKAAEEGVSPEVVATRYHEIWSKALTDPFPLVKTRPRGSVARRARRRQARETPRCADRRCQPDGLDCR